MKKETIVRAWKDPTYRASLTAEQRTALPESPSGKPMTELNESDLGHAIGGVEGIFPRGASWARRDASPSRGKRHPTPDSLTRRSPASQCAACHGEG
ncbi:mersacidin/lichenicidin family type 2 lantibiotic [Archangium lansingense]|uniref:mersacidin/lichenicidin family type 2 lantibiotic n=1 Tax=Archangium lansingense TaxID=2995310 RepID=UPI003B7F67F3